jgi:phosphatidylglycerol:prolipoprotein diacylglycerol transferase
MWKFNTPPMEISQVDSFITVLILGVILGGRLGYVLFYNYDFYLQNPVDILKVWEGGMSFHGGFLGVVIAVLLYCRFNGIPVLSGGDLIAVATPPGLMFGRISNFINAELWGRPTNVSWGVIFPGERAQDCPAVEGICARHPTQLYEASLEGLILFILMVFLAYLGLFRRPGSLIGIFLVGYGTSRYFIEFYRVADPQFISEINPRGYVFQFAELGVTMGQLLSLPMVIVGLIFLIRGALQRPLSQS